MNQKLKLNAKPGTKPILAGLFIGAAGVAILVPTLAHGNARDTVGTGAAAAATAHPYIAQLTGANEFPTVGDPDGIGTAAVTINAVTGEVCVDLRVANITTATAAHIHTGAAGAAGAILVPLTAPTPTSATCATITPGEAAGIVANPAGFYVNVHNADFAGGAIRGQLSSAATKSGTTQILNEPLRAYDSRTSTDGILPGLTTRTVSLEYGLDSLGALKVAVPPGAIAAMVRLTVTDTGVPGFLKIYSNALSAEPKTSNVNWDKPQAITGADTTVAVDGFAKVKVSSGGGATHFVIDVIGYVF